jgi:hypothetical protein
MKSCVVEASHAANPFAVAVVKDTIYCRPCSKKDIGYLLVPQKEWYNPMAKDFRQ